MNIDVDLTSIQEARINIEKAKIAQKKFSQMNQEQVDKIISAMAAAAKNKASFLASLAVNETGFGKEEDKVIKNLFAAKDVYESIKNKKTVGIIKRNVENKVLEVAEPVGIIVGIVPSTNPTSTIIYKSLIALKSKNAIIFSPHPSAAKCTLEAAKIMEQAAVQAGAPEGIISCIQNPTMAATNELLHHPLTDVILATGGSGMVKAAYSSGKPAYGVGPGNVPVYIHESANIGESVQQIIESKAFDYGTICASEQALVVDQSIKKNVVRELKKQHAYFLEDYEKDRVADIIMVNGRLNPAIVGKSPQKIAELAGIIIPESTKILVAEEEGIGANYPFSIEKLSPILALYTVNNWREGCATCNKLLEFGGLGHTVGIHCEDQSIIESFGLEQKAFRVVINTGTTFGGIGATTGLNPSLTLGCGSLGKNVTSDNIGPEHLVNIKRLAVGIRKMKTEEFISTHNHQEQAITKHENNITKEELREIVKSVLLELKI